VITSNQNILQDPFTELNSIFKALKEQCNIVKLKIPNETEIMNFVDKTLQHHTVTNVTKDCVAHSHIEDPLKPHLEL